jgi:hypothetical protein
MCVGKKRLGKECVAGPMCVAWAEYKPDPCPLPKAAAFQRPPLKTSVFINSPWLK